MKNQSHRTVQQYPEATTFPPRPRNVVILQEGREPHRYHRILHRPLQPGASGSITSVALPVRKRRLRRATVFDVATSRSSREMCPVCWSEYVQAWAPGGSRNLDRDGKGGSAGPAKLECCLRQIQHSGKVLLTLLNDLLDLAKLEASQMVLDVQPRALQNLLAGVVDEFLSLHAARELTLHYELPLAPLRVYEDAQRLRQVVRNLLSNAVKFSKVTNEVSCRACTFPFSLILRAWSHWNSFPQNPSNA